MKLIGYYHSVSHTNGIGEIMSCGVASRYSYIGNHAFSNKFCLQDVRMYMNPVMGFTAVWGSVTGFLTTRPVFRLRGLLSLSWTHETFCKQTFNLMHFIRKLRKDSLVNKIISYTTIPCTVVTRLYVTGFAKMCIVHTRI